MKKLENKINYYTKGELVGMDANIVTTVTVKKKEDVEDTVNFNDLLADVEDLCSKNIGKEISISFVAKISQ